ncbi:MAG: Mov34/MPN/PAD-1 family protein [Oscillospiraceae bacterium]|nr:Mov34/MPN/PAD-1 family protein [Oscillospiraceae bacterium]
MPAKVIFSERAYTALLAETNEKISTETGGVFLGVAQQNGVWYVVETIDPGPDSVFETTYFEYDKKYVTHLANKINKLYGDKLNVLGLWHRHPGSLDRFTNTDNDTNTRFANGNNGSTISAIINIDPKFRITVYSVTLNPLTYRKIPYEVDSRAIPKEIIEITPSKEIEELINSRNSRSSRNSSSPRSPAIRRPEANKKNNGNNNEAVNFTEAGRVLDMLARHLNTMQPIDNIDGWVFKNKGSDFEKIVGHLYDVIDFCEQKAIPVTIEKGKNNAVDIIFGKSTSPFKFSFFDVELQDENDINVRRICFIFNNRLYPYNFVDMLKSAWEKYIK